MATKNTTKNYDPKAAEKKKNMMLIGIGAGSVLLLVIAIYTGVAIAKHFSAKPETTAADSLKEGPGGLTDEERANRIGIANIDGSDEDYDNGGKRRESGDTSIETTRIDTTTGDTSGDNGGLGSADNTDTEISLTPADPDDDSTEEDTPQQADPSHPQTTAPQQPQQDTSSTVWVLQLGVYNTKDNAARLKQTLETEFGVGAYVAEINVDGITKYRVQMGAFKDRANADKMGRELASKGYKYYVAQQSR